MTQAVWMCAFGNVGFLAESLEQTANVGRLQGLALQRREHGTADIQTSFAFKPRQHNAPRFRVQGDGAILAAFGTSNANYAVVQVSWIQRE